MSLGTWTVQEADKPRFEKVVRKWHLLIQGLGWPLLCEMYVRRTPPFQDVQKLKGSRRKKLRQAKLILLANLVEEMKENGLEIKKGGP